MRKKTAHLGTEKKIPGHGVHPGLNGFRSGKPVEAAVDLCSFEISGIIFQPFGSSQFLWIVKSPPVFVAPAGSADMDPLLHAKVFLKKHAIQRSGKASRPNFVACKMQLH